MHISVAVFFIFLRHFVSQPDDAFDWLDIFPYRKGDPIVEQEDVFLLPVTQPLHNNGPVSSPPVKIGPPSFLKRSRACSSSLILFISLLLKFPFLASVSEALPLDFSDEKTLADSSQKKRPRMTPRMSTTNDNIHLLLCYFVYILFILYSSL
jgi:hypothetical protein